MLLALITTITSLLGLVPGGVPEEAATQDTLCLTVAMVSDTHVGDAAMGAMLNAGIHDISREDVDADAVVFLGDCTDNGNEENWKTFTASIASCTVKEKFVVLGNHDTWTSYDTPHEYEEALANYLKYANAIMGTSYTKPYYARTVQGYPFIVMAPEDTDVSAVVSEEQLDWVDEQLAAASENCPGKPIFVLMHQPMNDTHAVGKNIDGNGFTDDATSKRLRAILNKYPNVFYFSGHQHYGLNDGSSPFEVPYGFTTVEQIEENVTSVNLPAYGRPSMIFGGDPLTGDGLIVNVYADRVEFLGRNFVMQGWLDYKASVPLSGGIAE